MYAWFSPTQQKYNEKIFTCSKDGVSVDVSMLSENPFCPGFADSKFIGIVDNWSITKKLPGTFPEKKEKDWFKIHPNFRCDLGKWSEHQHRIIQLEDIEKKLDIIYEKNYEKGLLWWWT